jgi:hypothetical protein
MKKTILAWAMCLCGAVFAQENQRDTTTWYQHLQFKTALLNQSKILTGRLYDRVPEALNPLKYQGAFIDTFNTLTATNFKQLHWQHALSDVANNSNPETNYHTVDSLNWQFVKQGNIPINILTYAYDILKDDVFETGLIGLNSDSQLVHNSDNTPFKQFSIFAGAIWYPNIIENNNTVNFIIPSQLYVSNISTPITKIEFKPLSGNSRAITQNEPFTIYFEDTGIQTCVIKITYQTGVTVETGFSFYLQKKADIMQPDVTLNALANIPFAQACGNEQNYNPYGLARYYIKYANPDKKLRRPFIFVEGIDFDYRDYLNNSNNVNFPPAHRYGEFGWDVFVSGGAYPQSVPDFSDGQPFSLGLNQLAGQQGLIQQLLNQGYDIVLVDFARGADYVQKNAFALVKVIQEINDLKVANQNNIKEENIVIGASMGGLTTRYALGYMEKNNFKHCTRLWGSFDSPHLGANIPVGLQYALLFFANSNNQSRENIRRLNLPAAKQMLIRHISRDFNGKKEIETNASCFRNNLVSALTEIGWPDQLRKIALVNGNVSALGNGISNGTQLMEWNYHRTEKIFGVTVLSFDAAACNIYAQGRSDNKVFYGLITKEKPKFNLSFCLGAGGVFTTVIPNGPITITVALPGFFICGELVIDRFGKEENWYCGGADCPNLDGAPGGLHDGVKRVYDGINSLASSNKLSLPTLYHKGLVSFIPSISAVNVYNVTDYNYNIWTNIDDKNTTPEQTPFESYKGPELLWPNEGHVFLTKNNQWGNGYKGNMEYITEQMQLNYENTDPILPNTKGSNFNLGLKALGNLKTKTINVGGIYQINRNGLIGYGNLNGQTSLSGSTLLIKTVENCNENTNITINNGGQFIIGDATPNLDNNKAVVTFAAGSKLHINTGGILTIHKGSKLIIEVGATLIVEQGAQLLLAEAGMLEIKGTLQLGNNCTFSTMALPNHGLGKVRIVNTNNLQQIVVGTNSKISFNAANAGLSPTTVVLEVEGRYGLYMRQFLNPYLFECSNATIEMDGATQIYTSNSISLFNCIVQQKTGSTISHKGVIIDQVDPIKPTVTINYSKFTHATTGLKIRMTNSQAITMANNIFNYCETGLFTEGISSTVKNNVFTNCTIGWQIQNPIGSTLGQNLLVNYGSVGIIVNNQNTNVVKIESSNILNTATGMYVSQGELVAKCTNINNCTIGLTAVDGGKLTFNSLNGGGFNTIQNSIEHGISLYANSSSSGGNLNIINGNSIIKASSGAATYWSAFGVMGGYPTLSCAQNTIADPSGNYVEAVDVSGNFIANQGFGLLSTNNYFYYRCGYNNGRFHCNTNYTLQFLEGQINNTCQQSTIGGGGGLGKTDHNPSMLIFDSVLANLNSQNPNYKLGLLQLKELLMLNNMTNISQKIEARNLYHQVLWAFAEGVRNNQINLLDSSKDISTINDVKYVINKLIHQDNQSNFTFNYLLDKANLLRNSNERNLSISLLDSIKNVFSLDSADLALVDYWHCVNEAEQAIIDTLIAFDSVGFYYPCMQKKDITQLSKRDVPASINFVQSSSPNIQVYPNPTWSEITITNLGNSAYTISLYSIDGKKMLSKSSTENNLRINLDSLSDGIYILEIKNESGIIQRKILKAN